MLAKAIWKIITNALAKVLTLLMPQNNCNCNKYRKKEPAYLKLALLKKNVTKGQLEPRMTTNFSAKVLTIVMPQIN